MGLFLLLGAAAFLLQGPSGGSSSHTLYYFRTYISEAIAGLPRYVEVGYLDGQPIERYDNVVGKMRALVPWMNQSVGLVEKYWDIQSTLANLNDEGFGHFLVVLERYYSSSGDGSSGKGTCFATEYQCKDGGCVLWGYICDWSHDCKDGSDESPSLCNVKGFHTLQCIDGCELSDDGTENIYHREAYDGKETDEWEGVWDTYRHRKVFWGRTCIGWLRRHLESQKATPPPAPEPPKVLVIEKSVNSTLETLVCKVDGFFPKDIRAVWLKDGEMVEDELHHVNVVPNADGTYQAKIEIQVDPREAEHYECHVDHAALREPLHIVSRTSVAHCRKRRGGHCFGSSGGGWASLLHQQTQCGAF
ncbi:major histocompatibility complex class I-related gene protein-like isoform X2 [Sceloporus undulatus]|uniref:major histocompatibility complex class I-related gene protein-like isoform X2 n=1 Tax=Sceloporus undulatus TaxID=8520 RepID=UPI001C4BFAD4|nr:major histocompatibility complex class I-related gene protein-like isoform X2 [Sceloporus undulatus]